MTVKLLCAACDRESSRASETDPTGAVQCSTCRRTYCATPCFAEQHGRAPVESARRWTIAAVVRRVRGLVSA